MKDISIQVSGVSKHYRRGVNKGVQLLDSVRRRAGQEYFWALNDVSFEVKRGELFGIVGPNGAGKSTLLKILSGLTRPNRGSANLMGRVGSLLEVGTGFHPELTGRENIFLNGTLLGMRLSEVRRHFDEIVSFSGVEKFLDTPVKRYSSGMKVRLGFAIASHLDQEILLIDEVLAVGDASFRERSISRMDEITHESGRTVLFVGHNASVIASNCDRAILLEAGKVTDRGEAAEVVHRYLDQLSGLKRLEGGFIPFRELPQRLETEDLELTHLRLQDSVGNQVPTASCGHPLKIGVGFRVFSPQCASNVSVCLVLRNHRQQAVAVLDSLCTHGGFESLPDEGEFLCEFDRLPLMPGRYRVKVVCKVGERVAHEVPDAGEFTVTNGSFYDGGVLPATGVADVLIEHKWNVVDQLA